MQTRNRNAFTTIHTEGALLPVDLLQRISENDAHLEGLEPESYHLAPGEKLNEAINRSWNRLNGLWGTFQMARGRLGPADAGTTLTRERWLLPLFQELGFGRLNTTRAVEIDGKSYPISHRWQSVPLHLVGCGLDLGKRTPGAIGAARISPHSLLQEYLNRCDEAQWGLLSNGLSLRILRDNATLTRQAYVDFDLESMFEGEVYSDFVLLWLVGHQSRFEEEDISRKAAKSAKGREEKKEKEEDVSRKAAKGAKEREEKEEKKEEENLGGRAASREDCILERWSKTAQERGTRALDDLRRGVEEAIVSLGQGFLQQPLNGNLRARLKRGDLSAQDYYRQLLRLVYRLIFLFAAEDRELLLLPDAAVEAKERYQNFYSSARLRALAERQRGSRHHDRYEALRLVMTLLGSDQGCPALAIPALGGFLFDAGSTADLNDAKLDNQSLLSAVRSLAWISEGNTRRAVDYRNLGPEELGSVYESLLELHPLLHTDAGTFQLSSAAGNERKTTGSYYTPSSLIRVLLDSALEPVIESAVEDVSRKAAKSAKEERKEDLAGFAALREASLLSLKVCDPACGSGHFLIAAAHRIAGRLAQVRAGGDEPPPDETRRALRDVIRHCIYGVDLNPMAVELCKVNLWLESLEPGKPLSFLDAHIKCGNSLVGVGPKADLNDLEVPDEAFNPVTGDHKPTATLLKKRNKQEREGQESLFVTVLQTRADLDRWLAERTRTLEAMPEDNAAEVQAKAQAYQQVNVSAEYRKQQQIADLWTAAFFWKIAEPVEKSLEMIAPTQGQLRRLCNGNPVQNGLLEQIEVIRRSENFFHWPLEFAEVAAQSGFDCILGNPPWERIKLQEEEFFAMRDPQIATAANKAARQKLIDQLVQTNPALASAFEAAKHGAECSSKFVRSSMRYPLTAVGDVNTYALFAEHARDLTGVKGRAGIIVPTGIATDDTTKDFFGDLVEKRAIASLFDFENREKIFQAVDSRMKFCLLTLSGAPVANAAFTFFATRAEHLHDERRRFSLDPAEIALFNPNTRTMPVFRTRIDAELTRKIYQRVPVLINERTNENPWGVSFLRMFDMSNDSGLFATGPREGYVRLYEAKMFWHFDHRWNTFEGEDVRDLRDEEKKNPNYFAAPRYWVPGNELDQRLGEYGSKWLINFRDVTNITNERTAIFTIIPRTGAGHTAPIMFENQSTQLIICSICCFNSLTLDYFIRQKVGGMHLTYSYLRQFPVLSPSYFSPEAVDFIIPRALELIYTAYDLKPFAEDMGYHGEPFRWDEERRALLRAELDAYYARLYGLTRDELRYILDPQEVYGPDFPGETFRVLKDKEIRLFGEYRTRRLVLEAWDRLEGVAVGNPEGVRAPEALIEAKQEIRYTPQPKAESRAAGVKERSEPTTDQPTLTDFGLYQCEGCGKMVMGFEKESHEKEKHGGKSVEWRKAK